MSEEKFDNVRESAAHYGAGQGPKRDPKTGRFVPTPGRRTMTVKESLADSKKRFSPALKKLAE